MYHCYRRFIVAALQIGIKLSDYYKDSLIAKAGIYISNENLSNEFRFYDKRELYNFNYLGKEIGFSAKEELKDFFVIGQDEGESSYFLDVHDNLGLGIDTIWKVNRCDCEDFVVVGKKSKKHLHDVLVFALNKSSLFIDKNGSAWDYIFIDYKNKLGNGPESIYIISEKSKKLEEACYVAKDIVDLFRIFAEGEVGVRE